MYMILQESAAIHVGQAQQYVSMMGPTMSALYSINNTTTYNSMYNITIIYSIRKYTGMVSLIIKT